jgi:PAS domain S-box-containing protein
MMPGLERPFAFGCPVTADTRDDADWDQHGRAILDAAPDALLVVNDREMIIYVNRQTELLFGYARAALLGQPLSTLVPTRFSPTQRARAQGYIGLHPSTADAGIELFARRADGTEFPIEVSVSPVETSSGVLVTAAVRDISERRAIEAAARLNAARLSSAIESIKDAVALFDVEDRLVLCNSAYRHFLAESSSGPLLGRKWEEFMDESLVRMPFESEEARERYRADRLRERKDDYCTRDVRLSDGRFLRVTHRRALDGGLVLTVWDMTADMVRERELHDARLAAEAGSAAKSDFLSSMSHELRTPLNAVLGFAQLLLRDKRDPLSQRQRDWLAQVAHGGEHLLRLIDDILDLSRIEAGTISISTEPVSVPEVLEQVRTGLQPMAAPHEMQIELATIPDALPRVVVDRTRFMQILMNFGTNGLKYNRARGHVTFRVETPDARFVRVVVADSGIGIAPEHHHKLFQPFQRAGQEAGPIEGTGIGLLITKRLAERMGGRVGFRSELGVGSEFWVDVPAEAALADPIAPTAELQARLATRPNRGPRVVVYVEDNPANVTFMREALGVLDPDITLIAAPTAEVGLELVLAQPPAAIIMDINLPGMSGLDALRVLRERPSTRDVPVIALSASASERDKARGQEAGFRRYLTKPIQLDELEAALDALFSVPP